MQTTRGPYEGELFAEAISRLKSRPSALDEFAGMVARHGHFAGSAPTVPSSLLDQCHDVQSFQSKVICDILLELVESSSIGNFTFDGLENIDKDRAYLFISNHRDIILDAALLDFALDKAGFRMNDMVIGDNLLVNGFITDMLKLSGGITINRSVSSPSELKAELSGVSRTITDTIVGRKRSVWIAEHAGRAKDGNDKCSPAIIKMLYMHSKSQGVPFSRFLESVTIVPVSISYQFDPCDVSKARQLGRSKKANDDRIDMMRGLRMEKGDVHIHIGRPLDPSIADVGAAVAEIDSQICSEYRLHDTNWYCHDVLNGTSANADKYASLDVNAFNGRFYGLDNETLHRVLEAYARPVSAWEGQ